MKKPVCYSEPQKAAAQKMEQIIRGRSLERVLLDRDEVYRSQRAFRVAREEAAQVTRPWRHGACLVRGKAILGSAHNRRRLCFGLPHVTAALTVTV